MNLLNLLQPYCLSHVFTSTPWRTHELMPLLTTSKLIKTAALLGITDIRERGEPDPVDISQFEKFRLLDRLHKPVRFDRNIYLPESSKYFRKLTRCIMVVAPGDVSNALKNVDTKNYSRICFAINDLHEAYAVIKPHVLYVSIRNFTDSEPALIEMVRAFDLSQICVLFVIGVPGKFLESLPVMPKVIDLTLSHPHNMSLLSRFPNLTFLSIQANDETLQTLQGHVLKQINALELLQQDLGPIRWAREFLPHFPNITRLEYETYQDNDITELLAGGSVGHFRPPEVADAVGQLKTTIRVYTKEFDEPIGMRINYLLKPSYVFLRLRDTSQTSIGTLRFHMPEDYLKEQEPLASSTFGRREGNLNNFARYLVRYLRKNYVSWCDELADPDAIINDTDPTINEVFRYIVALEDGTLSLDDIVIKQAPAPE